MAAYTYFVKLIRDEHRKKHPDEHFDFAEFSAKCAEKWKSMKPEERKRFEELAAEDSEKKLSGCRKRKTRKRQKKAPGQPKRAWSAFFYFCDERRPKVRKEHPEWRVAEVARELGRLWEACSDRDRYEKMAVLDKERYEKEMEQFRAGNFVAGETKRPKLSEQAGAGEDDEEDGEEDEDGDEELDEQSGSLTTSGIGMSGSGEGDHLPSATTSLQHDAHHFDQLVNDSSNGAQPSISDNNGPGSQQPSSSGINTNSLDTSATM